MKSHHIFFIVLSTLLLAIASACNVDEHKDTHEAHTSSHEEETTDHHEEEMEHEEEVALTTEQMQKIGLKLGQLEQKSLQSSLKATGQLELPPQNEATVSAIAAGIVQRIHVKPGQYVKKGSTLATLTNPDFIEWQQQYLEAQGRLDYLNKAIGRQQDLVTQQITPQQELEKLQSEHTIEQAKIKGLKTKMQLLGIHLPSNTVDNLQTSISVSSPISGYIRDIIINTGIYIQPQQRLFEIVDNHHLHIDLRIFEKDIPHIKVGQILDFSLQSKPNEVMQAKVFAIGKALNTTDRTVPVHAEIIDKKHDHLLPGMYVEASIILADKTEPALPDVAITMDKGLPYIFIKEDTHQDETHFKKVQVLTGAKDFGYTAIMPLESLPDKAEIVTNGAYFLMAQTKKGEEGAGHHH